MPEAAGKFRIFYLSWIAPVEGSGATLAMRRHFVEHRDFEVFVATTADFSESGIYSLKLSRPAWLKRLSNTRWVRLVYHFEILFQATRLSPDVLKAAQEFRPQAVFTVADLSLAEQARKLARMLKVPLIVNFQDWWPRGQFYYDFEKPYFWARPILERRFRRLYREANLAFCTSEGMKEFLGPHPNSHVLYPIGARDESSVESRASRGESKEEKAKTDLNTDFMDGHGCRTTKYTDFHENGKQGDAQGTCAGDSESDSLTSKLADAPISESLISSADGPASSPATSHSQPDTAPEALALESGRSTLDSAVAKRRKKRLIYTGTAFGSYGKMLRELARELEKQEDWELVIFGNTPDWPKEELKRAQQTGIYHGLLKFEELQRELHEADACLAVMSFEPELEVMMRTSFTTKMLDYCRAGKPVVLWGPDYCSPIRLAKNKNAAFTVEKPEVAGVRESLHLLQFEKGLAEKLSIAALALSAGDLAHKNIHKIFILEINRIVGHKLRSK